jgi:hypothetical protein
VDDVSAEERLERIRVHCDNGIRYFTWALKRMPSIPEQAAHVPQVEDARTALARVLAYVEGAADEREAALATQEIVKRYERAVLEEAWKPSFSSGGPQVPP